MQRKKNEEKRGRTGKPGGGGSRSARRGSYRRPAFSSRGTWPTGRSWCRLPRPGRAGSPRRGRARRRAGLCRGPPAAGPWAARGPRPRGTGWLWAGSSGRTRPRRGAGEPRRRPSAAPPCPAPWSRWGSPHTAGAPLRSPPPRPAAAPAGRPIPAARCEGAGPRHAWGRGAERGGGRRGPGGLSDRARPLRRGGGGR